MPASRRVLAVLAPTATLLALAAPASAATLQTAACVRSVSDAKTMPIAVTGFTPGGNVTVRYASPISPEPSYLTAGTADAAGNFSTVVTPPLFNKFDTLRQSFTLTATDDTNPAIVATTAFDQVRIGYTTNPATGKPTRKATHTVRGFPTGTNVYLHFRYHGQTKRNVKLGKAAGPCGIVSKRMSLLPATSHPGTWTVYVDQRSTYRKGTQPQLKYSFVISRSFG